MLYSNNNSHHHFLHHSFCPLNPLLSKTLSDHNFTDPTMRKTVITCKLTGKTGQPVKAHVVPRAFYELPTQEEGPCVLASNAPNSFPKRAPVGVYDESMVTQQGEDLFRLWDDYAAQLLLQNENAFAPIIHHGVIHEWTLSEYDYSLLKLFSLSVLWRAHTSCRPEFKRVQLGPHALQVKNCLLNNNPGTPDYYSIHIGKWIDDEFGPVFMDPFSERYEGVNYYRIYCGRYILYSKVDKRPPPETFRQIQLGQTKVLHVIGRDLKASKEWLLMQRIARHNAR